MDTLTHTFAGVVSAHAISRVRPKGVVVVAAAVAANLPDADWWTVSRSLSTYFEAHRGLAHSALAVPVFATAVAACSWGLARRAAEPVAFATLLAVSVVALATHLALDALNPYGLRPLLPFDSTWYYGDLAAVVDPWIWLLLGGTALLLTQRRLATVRLWVILGTAITLAALHVIPTRGRFGPAAGLVWIAAAGVFLAIWIRGIAEATRRRIAVAGVAGVAVYVAALAVCHARTEKAAWATARGLAAVASEHLARVAAIPTVGDLSTWRALAETDRAIYRFDVALDGTARDVDRFMTLSSLGQRDLRDVSAEPTARAFLSFARFVAVALDQQGGGRTIRLADPRFDDARADRIDGWSVRLALRP